MKEALEGSFEKEELPAIDRSLVTRLAGAKHHNGDGTSRADAIDRMYFHERLVIRCELDHPKGDGFGKSVWRKNGQQLGWLSRELAREIHAEFVEPDHTWMAVYQYPTRHPETRETVGAVVLIVRRTPAGGEWFWERDQNTRYCVSCTTCGAQLGQRCKTKRGAETSDSHTARMRAFQALMDQRNAPISLETGQPEQHDA